MTKYGGLGLWAALLAGCASTQLEVARNDAADPNAATAPPAAAPRALRAEFEPAATAEPPQGKSAYTCPMHPEIKRSEPGQCPICGMNLVPEKKPESGHDHEAHSHEHQH
jgi:hypothetical protein